MDFLFSQICGVIVTISVILSMQMKNISLILICQLLINGIGAVSYILVGGLSGSGIYAVAFLQSLIYFVLRVKDVKTPKALDIFFIVLYLVCAVSAYKEPMDIVSGLAALTCAIGIAQAKPSNYRICMLLNGIVWMGYDLGVGAYTMIISHLITAISSLAGILRLDIKKNK